MLKSWYCHPLIASISPNLKSLTLWAIKDSLNVCADRQADSNSACWHSLNCFWRYCSLPDALLNPLSKVSRASVGLFWQNTTSTVDLWQLLWEEVCSAAKSRGNWRNIQIEHREKGISRGVRKKYFKRALRERNKQVGDVSVRTWYTFCESWCPCQIVDPNQHRNAPTLIFYHYVHPATALMVNPRIQSDHSRISNILFRTCGGMAILVLLYQVTSTIQLRSSSRQTLHVRFPRWARWVQVWLVG